MKSTFLKAINSFPEEFILDISFFLKDFVSHYPRIISSEILDNIKSNLSKEDNIKIDSLIRDILESDNDYFLLEAINQIAYDRNSSENRKLKDRVSNILEKLEINTLGHHSKDFEISIDKNPEKETKSIEKKPSALSSLEKFIQDEFINKPNVEIPDFSAGDTVTIYYEVNIDNRKSIESFKGIVLKRRKMATSEVITIRKMSGSIGVERIFPLNMSTLKEIELNKKGKVRKARIFYFKGLSGTKQKDIAKRRSKK